MTEILLDVARPTASIDKAEAFAVAESKQARQIAQEDIRVPRFLMN